MLRWRKLKIRAALFLRLGPPSTVIRREKRAFQKRSSNRGNLKTPAWHFSVDGKHFKKESVLKAIIMRYSDLILLKHKYKRSYDCCVFKFLGIAWPGIKGEEYNPVHARYNPGGYSL